MSDDDGFSNGPIRNPVDRFAHLPEPVRKFLEELREDDIDGIKEAIRFHHSVKTVSKFVKWLIITVVAFFVGAAAFGDAVMKIWGWLFRVRA